MSVDIAGSHQTGMVSDPRITYAPREASGATYRVQSQQRQRVIVRHVGGRVVLRDLTSGVEASGPTYLDALWTFQKARRGQLS